MLSTWLLRWRNWSVQALLWPGCTSPYCEAATVAPGQMPTPKDHSWSFRRLQPKFDQPSSVPNPLIQVDQNQAQSGPCVVEVQIGVVHQPTTEEFVSYFQGPRGKKSKWYKDSKLQCVQEWSEPSPLFSKSVWMKLPLCTRSISLSRTFFDWKEGTWSLSIPRQQGNDHIFANNRKKSILQPYHLLQFAVNCQIQI